ncbi:hypothetical protein DH86_00001961 [Scytalidium sp. 3C]|nr:hypothetical protein DH86_00001961 [Scytalidium sp. 3C]
MLYFPILLTSWHLAFATFMTQVLARTTKLLDGRKTVKMTGRCGGIVFEAIRLVMVQRLLSSAEFKMDPLVSLYYFAPVCAIMNFVVALFWEIPDLKMADIYAVGITTLFANAGCAFLLNVSVVFLIGKTSGLVLTLCGVLKDILLVVASMLIWGTVITPLQCFGYSIALGGLVYYKLGAETLKGYISEAGRQWADFGSRRPVLRRVLVLVGVLLTVYALLGGFAPAYADPKNYIDAAKLAVGSA